MKCLFCDKELFRVIGFADDYRCFDCGKIGDIIRVNFRCSKMYPLTNKNGSWEPTGECVSVISNVWVRFMGGNDKEIVFKMDRVKKVSTFEVFEHSANPEKILLTKHNLDLTLEEIPTYFDKMMLLK